MASKSDHSVPQIHSPPGRSSTADDDSIPHSGSPPISPATSALRSAAPHYLLQTPPPESQFSCRDRARTNTNGHHSAPSLRSVSQMTRSTSPSEFRSKLSPSISSGGGYSSGSGRSPCSLSGSDYLTPPQFLQQADYYRRPYKSRRQSSDSLTMMRRPKRANTMPRSKSSKHCRRHRHGRNRRHHHETSHECQEDPWCMPVCQIAPTAPEGMRQLCIGHVGNYKPHSSPRGNTDTYGRTLPRPESDPAPPLISRRWSSVENGSHQITISPNRDDDFSVPSLHRSSTFTRDSIDHDIVRTVRDRLTVHQVPSDQMQTPTTIILRRASGTSTMSGISTVLESMTPTNDRGTESTTPRPYPISQADMETNTAYLITRREIDSIAELIEANLRRNFRPHNRVSAYPPATPPAVRGTRRSSVTSKDRLPKPSCPAVSGIAADQAKTASSRPQGSPIGHLEVVPPPRRTTANSDRSTKMMNEVIWEAGRSSSNSQSSTEECKPPSRSESSTPNESISVTPHAHNCRPPRLPPPRADKGDAFDPRNARASIDEWSWRNMQAEIPSVVRSSDSESNKMKIHRNEHIPPEATSRTPIRPVASAPDVPKAIKKSKSRVPGRSASVWNSPEIEDVVFFPPLPRKATKDWFSPLPDIDVLSPRSPSPQPLYKEGLDATGAISTSLAAPQPQRLSHFTVMDRRESLTLGAGFDPSYDLRRKSIVNSHPQSPARRGRLASMGSSIGVSSGERRKSSIKPVFQRVRTIDHVEKGSRAGTWTRNRPPSVCPPPIDPSPGSSPSEISGEAESPRNMSPSPKPKDGRRPVEKNRHDSNAVLPKNNRMGIYARITGTMKSALGLDDRGDNFPPQHGCEDCMRASGEPSVDWIG